MARELIRKGFSQVQVLEGGWQAWLDLGGPTEAPQTVLTGAALP